MTTFHLFSAKISTSSPVFSRIFSFFTTIQFLQLFIFFSYFQQRASALQHPHSIFAGNANFSLELVLIIKMCLCVHMCACTVGLSTCGNTTREVRCGCDDIIHPAAVGIPSLSFLPTHCISLWKHTGWVFPHFL